jgi:sortase A
MRNRSDRLGGLERALWALGLGLAGWYGMVSAEAWIYQARQRAALEKLVAARADGRTAEEYSADSGAASDDAALDMPAEARVPGLLPGDPPPALGPTPPGSATQRPSHRRPPGRQLIGQLDIPRLKLSVAVVAGDDDATLRVAVGYLPYTSLPWEGGNTALAGHRDTFFRPLRDISAGDEIRLLTPNGELRYHVRKIFVVEPDAVWVLDAQPDATLTLITCFPFSAVGSAPWRFVVQAVRVG